MPSWEQYRMALQQPQRCFRDILLRESVVSADNHGTPLVWQGSFAAVFQLRYDENVYAIKCFIRVMSGCDSRYAHLCDYLRAYALPCFTTFEYLHEGIELDGMWHPIVRMKWVEGIRLDAYIAACLQNQVSLSPLMTEMTHLSKVLRNHHIGHGDLQHGNILVTGENARIMLVDYDGMYIPSLQKMPSDEGGHPNYQHPERIQHGYYDADVDRFAWLTIYLSVLAIERDPSLWDEFHHGDNLLFRADDFLQPGITPIWQRMEQSPDEEVCRLSHHLCQYCRGRISEVSSLETLLSENQGTVLLPECQVMKQTNSLAGSLLDFIYMPVSRFFHLEKPEHGYWEARQYSIVLAGVLFITAIIVIMILLIIYSLVM